MSSSSYRSVPIFARVRMWRAGRARAVRRELDIYKS
jgi:hypothetical protein